MRRVAGLSAAQRLTDADLLERYVSGCDEDAFAALVRRYGRLVRSVCRHVLQHEQDVDDAFQATFLVFASKAASIRKTASVASWLYGVAYRTAMNAKRARIRRSEEQREVEVCSKEQPIAEAALREVQAILDDEVNRLPEKYRSPFVLCCLEGKSRAEAARQLGWKEGTVFSRLARARMELQKRLSRRGVVLSAALCAAELSRAVARADMSPAIMNTTIKAAMASASGKAVAGGLISADVATLADGVLRGMVATKLKIATAVLLTLGFMTGAGVFAHQTFAPRPPEAKREEGPKPAAQLGPGAEQRAHTDRQGDPLPEGAVARLGTNRLRTSRHWRFAPESRRVVLDRVDGTMQFFEVPSGKPLALIRARDVPGRTEIIGSTVAFTPDGKYLAAVCWEGRCGIWETATGRLVRWLESGRFYSIVQCDFSPDGKLLAVGGGAPGGAFDAMVGVYEVDSGRRLFTAPGTNSVFARDGRSLITWNGYSNPTNTARRLAIPTGAELAKFSYQERFPDSAPRSDGTWFFEVLPEGAVRAWDVATGSVKHTFRGPGGGQDDVVYVRHVAGRRELIAVGTQPAGVWCWDLATGHELWKAQLAAPAYFPELSGDGMTLVTGDTTGTIRIWDAATGKVRASFRPGGIGHSTYVVKISPDGKTIATESGGNFSKAIAFWDAATGKLLPDLPGHPSGITAAAFAADGVKVYTIGKDQTLRVWDADTGRELSRASSEVAANLAVTPDGKTLFAAGSDGGPIRVLDATTGQVERKFLGFRTALVGLTLTADGKWLVIAGRERESDDAYLIRIYDAGTGAKLREFGGSGAKIEQAAVRPDGEAVATTHVGQRVLLWAGSGKQVLEKVGRGERKASWAKGETPYRIGSVGLSPDGHWLAYSDQEQGITIFNLPSGGEVGRAKPDVFYQNGAARYELRDVLTFSPDGKMVAWSGVESTADVFLIEVRTAQVRQRLPGDSSPVTHLAFSPDGSKLLSAGPDGAALIWDVLGRIQNKQPVHLSNEELERLWADLAGADAPKAYQAICNLAAYRYTVPFLDSRLHPVTLDLERIPRLISELDSERFASREKATADLEKLGELAEPALQKALQEQPSLEVRRRMENLLERLKGPTLPGQRLQTLRAIEVLEQLATEEAREVLRKLATGARAARETRDAAEALERLARRHAAAR